MSSLYTLPYRGFIDTQPQRQGINKQPHTIVGAIRCLHTPKQHGAKHHLFLTTGTRQHLCPGQMTQRRQTDT